MLVFQVYIDFQEDQESIYSSGEKKPYRVKLIFRGGEVGIEIFKLLSEPHWTEYHCFIYFPDHYRNKPCYAAVYGFAKVHRNPDLTNFLYIS
ncbi:hypothetical protein A1A1_07484 [Planococcus antarcticus DSM 14505]|uniref:Uncharacterized protein n=1 Tax=Planococcus antarcticus DSM 14505 TaxID=1185653 RepID=A0A1C7DHV9_9BACL|nr:hypothetical protein BBH88_12475 [Planococcus antarcticus DSM 14505]EIM07005.1 hypothetical protein A1A1_07484 [Planococcus antarcticus DSM 14505]